MEHQRISPVAIEYYEDAHKYLKKGTREKVVSVTQFIGFRYEDVPAWILQKAADRGSLIHKEIENYETLGAFGISDELDNYIELKKGISEMKGKPACEMILAANFFGKIDIAGRTDLYFQKSGLLADIKTSLKLDKEALQIQLSLYAWLMRAHCNIVTSIAGIWLNKKNTKFVPMEILTLDEIEVLVDKYLAGSKVELNSEPEKLTMDYPQTKIDKMIFIEQEMARLEEQYAMYKKELRTYMEKKDITSAKLEGQNGKLTLSVVQPSIRVDFNSKKLKEDNPDLYAKYTKNTTVKGSFRIKFEEYQKRLAS